MNTDLKTAAPDLQGKTWVEAVKELGIGKGRLAVLVGKKPSTVASWKKGPPVYVLRYLEELMESRRLRKVITNMAGESTADLVPKEESK